MHKAYIQHGRSACLWIPINHTQVCKLNHINHVLNPLDDGKLDGKIKTNINYFIDSILSHIHIKESI